MTDDAVYVGLGTNIGDRAANLCAALHGLGKLLAIEMMSAVYESDAIGHADQPRFWNMAVRGSTADEPATVLDRLQRLERDVGRVPTFRMGPRVIDLDVLLFGRRVIDDPGLRVPHAALLERAFVLRPLLDIEPGLTHPVTGESLDARLHSTRGDATLLKLGSPHEVLGDCVAAAHA